MSDYINKLPQGIRECIERPPIEDKIELAKSLGFFEYSNMLDTEKIRRTEYESSSKSNR